MTFEQRPSTPCRFLAAFSIALAAGCAGSTFGSGVGDEQLEHPPWYAGDRVSPGTRIVHFPIAYQRGNQGEPSFDPSGAPGTPIAALLVDMNRYLDSLGVTTRAPRTSAVRGTAPDVMFG